GRGRGHAVVLEQPPQRLARGGLRRERPHARDHDALAIHVHAPVPHTAWATMATLAPPKADFVLTRVRTARSRASPRTTSRSHRGPAARLVRGGGMTPPGGAGGAGPGGGAPAAPSVCPIIGLSEFTGMRAPCAPKTLRTAWHSAGSFAGVPVPCRFA